MTEWVLIRSLEELRKEFDTIAPERDKSSDGSKGDDAHSQRSSDHNPDETGKTPDEDSDKINEVHAIDVDDDLRAEGFDMEDCVQHILWRCRKSNSDPDNEPRLKYIIYKRRIWEAPDWDEEYYGGDNPHDQHAHFSGEYDSEYSEDGSPWGLIAKFGDELPMDQTSFNKLMDGWAKTTNGKKALETAAHCDSVQRYMYDDAGNVVPVPDSDGNPTMGVDSALGYLGKDMAIVKQDLTKLQDEVEDAKCLLEQLAETPGTVTG